MTDTNPDTDHDIDIAAVIKNRLTDIDVRLDHLTVERTRINDEIRTLREERLPLERLARAAEPRPKKKKPSPKPAPLSQPGAGIPADDPPT